MLFIESPGIVGFSTDIKPDFPYNDQQTADDAFAALKDFIHNVAVEFSNRQLFVCIYLCRSQGRVMLESTYQISQLELLLIIGRKTILISI